MKRNKEAYDEIMILPRVLRGIQTPNTETKLLGQTISFPIGIAPSARHQLFTEKGELATAKAAEKLNTVFTLSTASNRSIEEIGESCPQGLKWFLLQMYKKKEEAEIQIRRAEKSGFKAIVVMCDFPRWPLRDKCTKYPLDNSKLPPFVNVTELAKQMNIEESSLKGQVLSLTWEDIRYIKSLTKLPIILKGILHPLDAHIAVNDIQVNAIWVSNHGGRTLDGVSSTIDVLPQIVKITEQNAEIYVDGGIRRGSDVFKALAYGAKAVFIGRPVLYGLACEGEQGLVNVLDILSKELVNTMVFAGCKTINEISSDYVLKKQ